MQLAELARFTDDIEATVSFYEALLDDEPTSRWPGGAVFDLGSAALLVHETVDHGEAPGEDHAAFAVEDVDAACEGLADRGLEVEWPPADYDWGRSAYLRDPDGNLLELTDEHA